MLIMLFSCQLVCIYIRKAVRFEQGHHQPRFQSKARSLKNTTAKWAIQIKLSGISEAVIPQARTARATRSNPASTQYKIVKCKTVTFQKSFFNRSIRIWNTRVHNVDNFISSDLRSFRNALLYNYYFPALSTVYNPEDPRTWKTICLTCNTTRTLTNAVMCCF